MTKEQALQTLIAIANEVPLKAADANLRIIATQVLSKWMEAKPCPPQGESASA